MEIICDECESNDVLKQGFRDNKSGRIQKYQCYDCKSWFVEDDGFKKMRHKPEDIVRAVHMHNGGMSLFKTQDHLWQHDGVKVTPWTVSKWTKKYADFLKSASSRGKAKAQRKAASR